MPLQNIAREKENKRADGNRDKTKYQIPRTHTSLTGFGSLNEPAVEQTRKHRKHLGGSHYNLVPPAHLLYHFHIVNAVHGTRLLGEEFLDKCRNSVYNKDKSKWAYQVTKHPFFCGNRIGLCLAVHKFL